MSTEYMHTVNVPREAKEARPDFAVLVRFEDQILPALLTGADGAAISGLSNIAPELFVGLVRALDKGDLEKAAQLHRRILSLTTLGTYSDPPIGAMKLDVPIHPTVRGPALPAPAEPEGMIEVTLEAAGF